MIPEQYNSNPAFCPAPWVSVYINPDGTVDHCCVSLSDLGNLNRNSLADSIHNEKNYDLKQQILEGKKIDGCRFCHIGQQNTRRTWFLKEFQHVDLNLYDDPKKFQLKYLDLRWRNTCNSACVYCTPKLSSLWAKELGVKQDLDPTIIERSKEFITEHAHEIEQIYLAGGEPLLMKENEWLLNLLDSRKNEIKLVVNTNLSSINNPIFEMISTWKNVQWLVSTEATGPEYEYIRFPLSWETFDSNVRRLADNLKPGHSVMFLMVYCALSIESCYDCISWFKSLGIPQHQFSYSLQWVGGGHGDPVDPRCLNLETQQKARQRLQQMINDHYHDSMDDLLKVWEMPYLKENKLLSYLNELDQRRNLDSKSLYSDIWRDKE